MNITDILLSSKKLQNYHPSCKDVKKSFHIISTFLIFFKDPLKFEQSLD